MQLQNFVTEVLEGIGCVVEPVEYALCQVLIPEEYKAYFQNNTELELAFDFEVAQENPQSEFVTFGSFVFEQVLAIANQKAVSTLRFAEVERLILADPIKKIKNFFHNESGKITILDENNVMGVWAVFQLHVSFISDEKVESSEQVWVNLITGKIEETMKQEQHSIMYVPNQLYDYPICGNLEIEEAYTIAYNYVKDLSENRQTEYKQDQQLQKDIDRIESYYQELRRENDKRAERKGLSQDKIKEITAKSNAIDIEMDKQIEEIKNKFHGHTELTLDHGILYFIPMLKYDIEILHRTERKQQTLYYNPITKQFSTVKKQNYLSV